MANSQTGKRRKGKSKLWKDFSLSERITWIGTILGLIVDTVAILQLTGYLFQPFSNSFPKTSPYFAISIWLLAIFTYLALLHSYWERHRESENLDSSFSGFLIGDLMLEFHKPFLLLPFIFLLLVFFPIAVFADSSYVTVGVCGGLLVMGLFILLFIKFILWTGSHTENTNDIDSLLEKMKQQEKENQTEIESEWDYWEKRIATEFERKWGVTMSDFEDTKKIKGYRINEFRFIFAKYAFNHPDTVRFGILWEKSESNEHVKLDEDVLVFLPKLDSKKYWIN